MTSVLEPRCSREFQCIAMNGSLELMYELRSKLREWLEQQPHLPHDMTDCRLEYFIVSSKHSLEKAKQTVDMYYTVRKHIPEFFSNRDPLQPSMKQMKQFAQWVTLPKLTPEKYRASIMRFTSENVYPSLISDIYKYSFMVGEVRIVECTGSIGDVYIYDLSFMRLGHLPLLNPSLLKKCHVSATKVFGAKIKSIHFINVPSFIDRVVTLVKSLLKPKLAARVFVHSDLESLYKHVHQSILPVDYGGDELSMDELDEKWHQTLEEWRDWFLQEETKTADEDLRPGTPMNEDELFGLYGSFRKLQVD